MRKTLFLAYAICLNAMFMVSCSSDIENAVVVANEEQGLKSNLTSTEIAAVNDALMNYVTPTTRSVQGLQDGKLAEAIDKSVLENKLVQPVKLEITEIQARKVCKPYIDDGKNIQSQMLRCMAQDGASYEDIQYIRNLSEEQLAMLSFAIYNIQNANQGLTRSVDGNKVLRCIWTAVGIPFGIDSYIAGTLSLSKLAAQTVSWKFALKLCRTMAIRYVGFISVAVCVYDFIDCM